MVILIVLDTIGEDADFFNLYSNASGDWVLFDSGVRRDQLLPPGYTVVAPDFTTQVRVESTGVCTNSIILNVVPGTTTTSTTSTTTSSTTTTTTTAVPCVTVNIAYIEGQPSTDNIFTAAIALNDGPAEVDYTFTINYGAQQISPYKFDSGFIEVTIPAGWTGNAGNTVAQNNDPSDVGIDYTSITTAISSITPPGYNYSNAVKCSQTPPPGTTTTTCATTGTLATNSETMSAVGVLSISFTVNNSTGVNEILGIDVTDVGNHGLIWELFESDHTTSLDTGIVTGVGVYDTILDMESSTNKTFWIDITARPGLPAPPNCVAGNITLYECDGATLSSTETENFAFCDTDS